MYNGNLKQFSAGSFDFIWLWSIWVALNYLIGYLWGCRLREFLEITFVAFIIMVALVCLLQYFGAGRGEGLRKLQPYSNNVIIGGALILGAIVMLGFTVL